MDVLQKEHERLSKRLSSSKTVDEIQKTIDLLQEARNTIAAGMFNNGQNDSARTHTDRVQIQQRRPLL